MSDYKSVFHESSIRAWKEIETALTSFLSLPSVVKVRTLISGLSSESLAKGNIGSVDAFIKKLQPICKAAKGGIEDPQELFNMLYMMGVVYTVREEGGGRILHSFHRGQFNPDLNGTVAVHRGVAKAFT